MAAIFGHAWVSNYGASPEGVAADTWAAVLAGLTPQQIAQGLQRLTLQGGDWPPSAPAFRALCIGIPSLAAYLNRFSDRGSTHPFDQLAWAYIDGWKWRNATGKEQDRLIRDGYRLAKEQAMEDGHLPDTAEHRLEKLRPEPPPERTPEEQSRIRAVAEEAIKTMRRQFHMGDDT